MEMYEMFSISREDYNTALFEAGCMAAIDDVLQWEMTRQIAEKFFYKYGLLTDLK